MSDDLRTRIAAAIAKHYPGMDYDGVDGDCSGCDLYLNRDPGWEWEKHSAHLADAVIREIGLTQEFGCGTSDLRHGCRCSHRYVTEWEPVDYR